ncbi:MAG: CBS domain-containing protein [Bacteroidetes bacterium]|nr:CBS domain-containing protein [Bacteroidota bacterium]
MLIRELISENIPTLSPTDTGDNALRLMEEAQLTELPLVQDQEYLGLIKEAVLLDWDTPERALSQSDFLPYKPAIPGFGHPLDALRLANSQQIFVVPVLDKEQKYIGAITRNDLIRFVAENTGIDTPGGIIILELQPRQYSLSEIARICENEDVLITFSSMKNNLETAKIEVTLKTNKSNLEALVSSFERHEYIVKDVFGAASGEEDLQERYRLLMNYINM